MSEVVCELCPHACRIAPGRRGQCRIRVNLDGRLQAVTYGYPCSLHMDPVEKKPLYHFLPGTGILSVATVGCNLQCKNCQNWQISQRDPETVRAQHCPPAQLVQLARQHQARSLAFTYTEPIVFYEYTLDSCVAAQDAGLYSVLVTAGYVNAGPWRELCRHVDAANIDLKAFSNQFYRDVCGASLQPVLNALVAAKGMGVLVEVTNLIIPTLNDSDQMLRELCRWVKQNLGRETPLHFSGFRPHYKMRHLPPTPASSLTRARDIAHSEQLDNVYLGNLSIADGGTTYCPRCRHKLLERQRFVIAANYLHNGCCPNCNQEIHGIWK